MGAFLLKKLDETNVSDEVAFEGHLQLSTVLEDSGALVEASEHVRRASLIKPDDARLRFRSALLVPAVSSSQEAVNSTRRELELEIWSPVTGDARMLGLTACRCRELLYCLPRL